MPHIDARTGEIVIRIVYDGAPGAGKRTNIRLLSQLVGLREAESPEPTAPRASVFDWLDFAGATSEGCPVRCQLVTVPDTADVSHGRSHLLKSADTVVLVADSHPDTIDAASRDLLATTIMARREGLLGPIRMILQANKQDVSGALTPGAVREALGLVEDIPVVGSIATRGDGVLKTLILAVKSATERVRQLKRESVSLPTFDDAIEMTVAQLSAPAANNEESIRRGGTSAPIMVKRQAKNRIPSRLNDVDALGKVQLPVADELAAGHVWPSVTGRNNIARAMAEAVPTPGLLVPWAPVGGGQLHNEQWFLHTSTRWTFQEEPEARRFLHRAVTKVVSHVGDVPEGRTLAIARDGGLFRLWVATPRCNSVAIELLSAVVDWPVWSLPDRMGQLMKDLRARSNGASVDVPVAAGAFGLSVEQGRLCLLAFEDDDDTSPIERRVPSEDLVDLALEWFGEDDQLRRSVERRTRRSPTLSTVQ